MIPSRCTPQLRSGHLAGRFIASGPLFQFVTPDHSARHQAFGGARHVSNPGDENEVSIDATGRFPEALVSAASGEPTARGVDPLAGHSNSGSGHSNSGSGPSDLGGAFHAAEDALLLGRFLPELRTRADITLRRTGLFRSAIFSLVHCLARVCQDHADEAAQSYEFVRFQDRLLSLVHSAFGDFQWKRKSLPVIA